MQAPQEIERRTPPFVQTTLKLFIKEIIKLLSAIYCLREINFILSLHLNNNLTVRNALNHLLIVIIQISSLTLPSIAIIQINSQAIQLCFVNILNILFLQLIKSSWSIKWIFEILILHSIIPKTTEKAFKRNLHLQQILNILQLMLILAKRWPYFMHIKLMRLLMIQITLVMTCDFTHAIYAQSAILKTTSD